MAATLNGTGTVDLDQIHRARREASGEGPTVTIGGIEYRLPPRVPTDLLIAVGELQAGRLPGLREAIAALFGADNVAAVVAAGFDVEDFEPILDLYGPKGFSSASGGSS